MATAAQITALTGTVNHNISSDVAMVTNMKYLNLVGNIR